MAAANGDLAAKYQRLATEYAKLKAQIPVLKKAVIDEQTKVSFIIPSHASEIDPSAVWNIFYPRLVSISTCICFSRINPPTFAI